MADFVNNLSTVFASFLAHMKRLEGAAGNGSDQKIRKVAEGEATLDAYQLPYVVLQVLTAKVVGRIDDNKIWECNTRVRVTSVIQLQGQALAEILAKIAQVENTIESFPKPEGTTGFEDPLWGITYQNSPDHGNLIIADATFNYRVVVKRGNN